MLKEHTESSAFSACYLGKAATSQSLILGVLKGMDSTESGESRLPSDFLLLVDEVGGVEMMLPAKCQNLWTPCYQDKVCFE